MQLMKGSPFLLSNVSTKFSRIRVRGSGLNSPRDFTFVCPTEILAFNDALAQFEKLNTAVLGKLSANAPLIVCLIDSPTRCLH